MADRWDLSLSASKLSILRECPLCFWYHVKHRIEKPRGIFPSLPGGMDRVLKQSVDEVRGAVPWFLEGQVPGVLFKDLEKMQKMRNWRSGLKTIVETPSATVSVIGALDDLLQDCPCYAPLDWKTKGDEPKNDGAEYYQTQVDVYGLLLRDNHYALSGMGYLVYVWPTSWDSFPSESASEDPRVPVSFGAKAYQLECQPDRAVDLIIEAARIATDNEPPLPKPKCELCNYITNRRTL